MLHTEVPRYIVHSSEKAEGGITAGSGNVGLPVDGDPKSSNVPIKKGSHMQVTQCPTGCRGKISKNSLETMQASR